MTYSQMTKNIENIKKQIDFMYELQKEQTEPNKARLIGDIVNNLCAYKNYLIYAKEYKEE
jgi:hypothetical protein